MRQVRWSDAADRAYNHLLDHRAAWSNAARDRAEDRVDEAIEVIARRPLTGRRSHRWSDCYEKTVRREHKIIVYEFDETELRILLLVDARQDLDLIQLPRE